MNIQISDIGHVIQLAIAPVFLLTGVGTKLMVLTNRLARIIDRSRVLEDRLEIGADERYMSELDILYGRAHLINTAITLSTACGLLICLVIAMLFLGDTTSLPLDKYIAGSFVLAMVGADRQLRFPAARNFHRFQTHAAGAQRAPRARHDAGQRRRGRPLTGFIIMHDYQRPPTLHRYAPRAELELALREGQFRLMPANQCLTLSFSTLWDKALFDLLRRPTAAW